MKYKIYIYIYIYKVNMYMNIYYTIQLNVMTKHKCKKNHWKCWLHLTNIRSWKWESVSLERSGRKAFPATLKSLSTGAEVAGIARY